MKRAWSLSLFPRPNRSRPAACWVWCSAYLAVLAEWAPELGSVRVAWILVSSCGQALWAQLPTQGRRVTAVAPQWREVERGGPILTPSRREASNEEARWGSWSRSFSGLSVLPTPQLRQSNQLASRRVPGLQSHSAKGQPGFPHKQVSADWSLGGATLPRHQPQLPAPRPSPTGSYRQR